MPDGIVDVARHFPGAPTTMVELMSCWSELRDDFFGVAGQLADYALDSVSFHAPIPRPGKIFGIGLNYADHALETGHELPKEQFWFCKAGTARMTSAKWDKFTRFCELL